MNRKIKQLIENNNLTEYEVTKRTALPNRARSLMDIASGDKELTSVNLNLASTYARALGIPLEELFEPWELDGTTGQILGIKKNVAKTIKNGKPDVKKEYEDGSFVYGINLRSKPKSLPILKKDYEFIDPSKSHDQQDLTEIYLLNRDYIDWENNRFGKKERNNSLTNLDPRFNAPATSFLIYSVLPSGGDFKTAATTYNKAGDLLFSEVYGCEWIETEDNQQIMYYKSSFDKPVTLNRIQRSEKEEISELEFFEGLHSQYLKFGVHI